MTALDDIRDRIRAKSRRDLTTIEQAIDYLLASW